MTPPRYPQKIQRPRSPHRKENSDGRSNDAESRAARLAAMSANASILTQDRKERLAELLAKEKAELEQEELVRSKSKGMGGFLSNEQKKVFSGAGGLEDRIRRGRGGMVIEAE